MLKTLIHGAVSSFSIALSAIGFVAERQAMQQARTFGKDLRAVPVTSAENYPPLSILIPARNEEADISACLESVLAQDYPNFEVITIDDNSTDRTGQILEEFARKHPDRLRLINIPAELPEGWLGKNNALWHGYQHVKADSEWLLFMDADSRLKPDTLRTTIAYARHKGLDLLSLVPSTQTDNFWQRVMIAEVIKFYALAMSNPLHPPKAGSIEEATASGAFILVGREAYKQVDGHKGVRNNVIEDVELARQFRRNGYNTVQQADVNADIITSVMDPGLKGLWFGVSKNLFLVAGKKWSMVAFLVTVEFIYGLLPFILLLGGKGGKPQRIFKLANLAACSLILVLNSQLNYDMKVPRRYALLYPLSAVLTSALTVYSAFRVTFRNSVRWKGREVKVY